MIPPDDCALMRLLSTVDASTASSSVLIGRLDNNNNWKFTEASMVSARAAHFLGVQLLPQDPSQAKVVIAGGYNSSQYFSSIEVFTIDATLGAVTQPTLLTPRLAQARRDLEGGCGSRTCAMIGGVYEFR